MKYTEEGKGTGYLVGPSLDHIRKSAAEREILQILLAAILKIPRETFIANAKQKTVMAGMDYLKYANQALEVLGAEPIKEKTYDGGGLTTGAAG